MPPLPSNPDQSSPSVRAIRTFPELTRVHQTTSAMSEALSIFSCSLPGDAFEGETEFRPATHRFQADLDESSPDVSPRGRFREASLLNPSLEFVDGHRMNAARSSITLPPFSHQAIQGVQELSGSLEEDGHGGILSFNPRPIQGASSSSKTHSSSNGPPSTDKPVRRLPSNGRLPPLEPARGLRHSPSATKFLSEATSGSSLPLALHTLHDSLSEGEESDMSPEEAAPATTTISRIKRIKAPGGLKSPSQTKPLPNLLRPFTKFDENCSEAADPASTTLDPRAANAIPSRYDPNTNMCVEEAFFSTVDTNPRLHEQSRYGIDEIVPGLLYLCAGRALRDMSRANRLGITAFVNAADEINEHMLGTNSNFFASMVSTSGSQGLSVSPARSSCQDHLSRLAGKSTFATTSHTSMTTSGISSIVMSPSCTTVGTDDTMLSVSASFPRDAFAQSFVSARIRRRLEASTGARVPLNLRQPTYSRGAAGDPTAKLFLRLPMRDTTSEVLKYYIEETWNFIEMCRTEGRRVVVFCKEGKSRSVSLVLGYVMRKFHMSFADALEYVRDRRQAADPNIGFCLQLQDSGCFNWDDGVPNDHYDGSSPHSLFSQFDSSAADKQ